MSLETTNNVSIIAIAIKIPMGKIYSEKFPSSHYEIRNIIFDDVNFALYAGHHSDYTKYEGEFIHGYLLSDGSFVDRFEGFRVAVQADQLKEPPCAHAICLFSYYLKENH